MAQSVPVPGRVAWVAVDSHEVYPLVRVRGARVHNLRDVDADMPKNALVAFTGVSGSGKSSLALGTLYAESQRRSSPSSRSTVGTVTAISNSLRLLMSREGDYPQGPARTGPGHYPAGPNRLYSDAFSPNTVEGACPRCHGQGVVHEATEASMVPDPSLSIRGGAIAEVLAMSVDQPAEFLADVAVVARVDHPRRCRPRLSAARSARDRLSGGEAQRVKLATELQRARRTNTIYLLDEPTTCLHPADTDILLTRGFGSNRRKSGGYGEGAVQAASSGSSGRR